MSTPEATRALDELRRRSARLSGAAWGRAGLACLLVATAVFVYHETRGTTLWFDDWVWALDRRGGGIHAFLDPYNQHLSLVPVAIYKLLFATAGLGDYRPYRVLIIAGQLSIGTLVFVYVSRRLGNFFGLLAAALILLLGPGWQNILWPFQLGWLISLAAGIGALLALDRGDRRGELAAGGLLLLSLGSSGIGLVMALGLVVEVLLPSDRRRRLWVVAIPLALYALWWLTYQDSHLDRHNIVLTPSFVAKAAASALSALAGLTSVDSFGAVTNALTWGPALLVVALAFGLRRLYGLGGLPVRVASLLTMAVSFWVLTGLTRASLSAGADSRYLYVGCLLFLLLAAELARGVAVPLSARLIIGVLVAAAVISNVGAMRDGGRFLRLEAQLTEADAGALDVGRASVPPGYVAQSFPGYPLVLVRAARYFSAERANGTPALSADELAAAPEPGRAVADAELTRIHDPRLQPPPPRVERGAAPAVDAVVGGTILRQAACVSLRPAAVVAGAAGSPTLDLRLPPSGLLISAESGRVAVSLRRFAAGFPASPLSRLSESASAVLRVGPDRARQPWHVRLASDGRVRACGIR